MPSTTEVQQLHGATVPRDFALEPRVLSRAMLRQRAFWEGSRAYRPLWLGIASWGLMTGVAMTNSGLSLFEGLLMTLLDMMTIRQRKGHLDHLTIGFCGDLKFGRTVHSLIKSLSRLPGMKFVLISPEELRVPDYIISEILEPNNIPYVETRSMEEALPDLDVLYMTRVQRERFFNEEDYIRLKNSYVLTKEKLALAPADMPVLHPLPRVNEITLDVDDDPRAAYFDQVQNGVYMRMALIMTLLGLKDPKTGEVAFNVEG